MKASLILSLVLATLVASQDMSQAPTPAMSCSSLTAPAVPDASVVSIQATEMRNMQVRMMNGSRVTLNYCDVNVTLTHGNAGDRVRIEVWLPLDNWNMRFQGTGGGGFVAGTFGQAMAPQVALGYAAASTDAGLGPSSFDGSNVDWNQQLLVNFASLSVHEMAVVGKELVNQFYGMPAFKAYWNGCSTGGRQGMMEAQSFPDDFDGILAIAPAINWGKFVPAELWPYTVMNTANLFPPACVFNALTQAIINACDDLDGARDGVISTPGACNFNISSMVGRSIGGCNATSTMITTQHAEIYKQILAGPISTRGEKLWYGLLPGTSVTTLASQTPFSLGASWLTTFVLGQGGQNITAQAVNDMSVGSFTALLEQSQAQFDVIIGTDNPNLSAFRNAGGKLLTWHGLADQIIFPNGTFDYRQRVADLLANGDNAAVDEFYRVFSAPGIMHCAGGAGAMPTDPLAALVNWVEKGQAPDTLPAMRQATNATQGMVTRNLCRYPMLLQYNGQGSVNDAQSWGCAMGPDQQIIAQLTLSQTTTLLETSSARSLAVPAVAVLVPAAVACLAFL